VDCNNRGRISHKGNAYKDSINIRCPDYGDRNFYLSGTRLFPDPCLRDDKAFNVAEKTGIFLILEKRDTLYILSDKDIFSDHLDINRNLPVINDSTINIFYRQKYYISQDPDPPNWTSLENEKDTIIIMLNKNKKFFPYWVKGVIQDSIFSFKDGLKVDIDKKAFFHKILGIDFSYEEKDFTVVWTSIFESNISWYFHYYCSKYNDKIYCHPDGFNVKGTYLKFFLTFKRGKIVKILVYS
jgi:hypothetical protein